MGGYQVRTEQLRVNTGPFVSGLSSTVDAARSNLDAFPTFGEVAAGTSIGPAVTVLRQAWEDALPDFSKELDLLGHAVVTSATMLETVEVQVHNRFQMFAE